MRRNVEETMIEFLKKEMAGSEKSLLRYSPQKEFVANLECEDFENDDVR